MNTSIAQLEAMFPQEALALEIETIRIELESNPLFDFTIFPEGDEHHIYIALSHGYSLFLAPVRVRFGGIATWFEITLHGTAKHAHTHSKVYASGTISSPAGETVFETTSSARDVSSLVKSILGDLLKVQALRLIPVPAM